MAMVFGASLFDADLCQLAPTSLVLMTLECLEQQNHLSRYGLNFKKIQKLLPVQNVFKINQINTICSNSIKLKFLQLLNK